MNRNMFLALVASVALMVVSAGSVAEAGRWYRGNSRGYTPYGYNGYNGFRGNYRGNYRGYYNPSYRYNYRPYGGWNGYGNNFYNPYSYGNGGYYGSNGAGIYFRF